MTEIGAAARRAWIAYLATAVVFLPCDAIWLAVTGPRIYRPALGHLLAEQPDLRAAALFYALYLVGIVAFAVRPAVRDDRPFAAAARGALFGLIAYATYDLTNQATLRGWPWALTAVDLIWGSALSAAAALAARATLRLISGK